MAWLLLLALPFASALCDNGTLPIYGLISRELVMQTEPVRGIVTLVSTCEFMVQNLEINSGFAPMWMGASSLTSADRVALTDPFNSSVYLTSSGYFVPQVSFTTDYSLDEFPVLFLVDSDQNVVLGSVRLDGPNPAPLATSLPRCLQLAPNYRLRWDHNDQEVDFALEGAGSRMSWLAFGPAAPGVTNRAMGGADSTFLTISPPTAVDAYLSAYLECYHGSGACADVDTSQGLNAVPGPGKNDSVLIYAQRLGSINFARFRRLLDTNDDGFDHVITPNSSQLFVWGAGNFLNGSAGVKYLTHDVQEGVSHGSTTVLLEKATYSCKPFPVQPNNSIIISQNTSADQFESKFVGGARAELGDSSMILFWKLDDVASVVKFGLRSKQQSAYLSLGIGSIMAGSKTWVAVQGASELYTYHVGAQTAASFNRLDEQISGFAWYSQNGIFSFEFAQPYGDLDVNSNVPFIWAVGPSWHNPPSEDDYHTVRSGEPTYINLRTGQVTTGSGSQLIVAHGVLMALAWVVFVPLSIALMRGARLINRPKWQLYHPWLNCLAALLSFIGVIVIVAMLYENQAKHLFSEHAKLGLATLVLFAVQLLIGLLRPSLGQVNVNERSIPMDEVVKHNTAESCWIVVRDRVYDVTSWLEHHPGGRKVLLQNAGKDATALFEKSHPSPDNVLKEHAGLSVGVLADPSPSYVAPPVVSKATEMSELNSSSSETGSKSFTLEQVAQHASSESCWLAVRGNVYDVTAWLDRHPGGREVLLENAGKDATEAFEKHHEEVEEILRRKHQLCIGTVNTSSHSQVVPVVHEPLNPPVALPVALPVAPISSLHSQSQKQRIWFWTHRILGLLTLCLSWATIYDGLDLLPTRGFPSTTALAPLACAWFILLTLYMGYFLFLHKWAVPRLDKKYGGYLAAAGCVMLVCVALILSITAGVSSKQDNSSPPVTQLSGPASSAVGVQLVPCEGALSLCRAPNCARIGDGWCDAYAPYNTAECEWDGGDCCSKKGLFRCLDPASPFFNTSSVLGFSNITFRNTRYDINSNGQVRSLSDQSFTNSYNNFYEFGFEKGISDAALAKSSFMEGPWNITIDGLVENPITMDVKDLINLMHLEERTYRHRCVEAWSIVVPWLGFPLYALLALVKPLPTATYVKFTSFNQPWFQSGFPWPYVEGLTLAEAQNELAFLSVGSYGSKMTPQSGAPIRLTIPWKYGFKSVKSLVRIELTSTRPTVFWQEINSNEYGFWSNVNPAVPHPRWSQASERPLGGSATSTIIPTQYFNGYADLVSYLYTPFANLTNESLYK